MLSNLTTSLNLFVAFQLQKIEDDSRSDEFELTYLRDASSENTRNKTEFQNQQYRQQQQQFFIQLLRWITLEGDEFVHIETFSDLEDVFIIGHHCKITKSSLNYCTD